MRRDYDRYDYDNRQSERRGRDDGERGYWPDSHHQHSECERDHAYMSGWEDGHSAYERHREEEAEREAEQRRWEREARERAEMERAQEEEYYAQQECHAQQPGPELGEPPR